MTALWEELGLNPRSGRRYLQHYEELKDRPDLCEEVEAGAKTIAQARREAGTLTTKPRKKTSLFHGKGAMGFLEEVKAYALKQLEHYEEQGILSPKYDDNDGQVSLILTIKL